MILSEMLRPEAVSVSLAGNTKHDIIAELITLLAETYAIEDTGPIEAAVLKREELFSTGLGNGIAIPHAKVASVRKMMVSFGLKKEGIDFQSLDSQPAHIFFMVVTPGDEDATEQHLRVMARISRMLKNEDFCRELLESMSEQEVLEKITREESRFA